MWVTGPTNGPRQDITHHQEQKQAELKQRKAKNRTAAEVGKDPRFKGSIQEQLEVGPSWCFNEAPGPWVGRARVRVGAQVDDQDSRGLLVTTAP